MDLMDAKSNAVLKDLSSL